MSLEAPRCKEELGIRLSESEWSRVLSSWRLQGKVCAFGLHGFGGFRLRGVAMKNGLWVRDSCPCSLDLRSASMPCTPQAGRSQAEDLRPSGCCSAALPDEQPGSSRKHVLNAIALAC